ncbi:hypothetical protein D9M68_403660 [compost metagenome]
MDSRSLRLKYNKIIYALSAVGEAEGSIGDGPRGTYAGMFRDKYGMEWIVDFDPQE